MKKATFKTLMLPKGSKTAFSLLAGINRPIKPAQVTTISNSINKMGIVRPVLVAEIDFITGKRTKYIVDGQHLFTACLRNNVDIPYKVIDVKDKADLVEKIALLNASSKNWTMVDYVLAWSSINPDYVKLNQYYNMYDFEMLVVADILSGNMSNGSRSTNKLKRGEFKIINEKENVQILSYLTDVLKVVPRMNRYENRYLCTEYVRFVKSTKDYNHDLFIKKITRNKTKFVLATQESGKLFELFKNLK